MAVTIPLDSALQLYDLQVELDNVTYGLRVVWNYRADQWAFSIFDAAGLPIAENIGLVVGVPLAKRIKDARMPPGTLIAFDSANKGADPGLTDLGTRTVLCYFPEGE